MLNRLFGKKTTPKVCLMGMNERALNVFTMFLNDPSKNWCEIVSDGSHEIVIVDLDSMDNSRLWVDLRRDFQGPAIVLSVSKRELANAYWVEKPVKPEQFKHALEQAKLALAKPSAKVLPQQPAQATPLSKPKATPAIPSGSTSGLASEAAAPLASAAATVMSENLDERSQNCCGDLADEVYLDLSQRERLFYDYEQSLLSLLLEAMRMTAKGGMVSFVGLAGRPLYVSAAEGFVSTTMPEAFFRSLCVRSVTSPAITLVLVDKTSADIGPSADRRLQRLDNLVWKVALWSSRGRVSRGVSLDAPVRLRAWPNIPRLMSVPHSLRIVALWASQPTSLLETAGKLGVPHRYVFSLYCACNAFGLVEQLDATALAKSKHTVARAMTQEKRSLFGSLLKKLGF